MTNYVLIHGGAHAGWCWEKLVPYLEEDTRVGKVVSLDLVGHGARLDEKPHKQITLEDYIQDIAGAVNRLGLQDVVLVPHSLAGVSTPQAAARIADRVKRIVFVSALIPPEGWTGNDTFQDISRASGPAVGGYERSYRYMFCNDLDEDTAQWLLSRLGPEPAAALTTPVSRRDFSSSIPTTYLVLTQDQALPPDAQRQLLRNIGDPEVVELESGHDAMVSHPGELAQVLLRYA
jgi:pimeloyl-ACP methyl ester carboxylesterase